jgi:hypothetical protein
MLPRLNLQFAISAAAAAAVVVVVAAAAIIIVIIITVAFFFRKIGLNLNEFKQILPPCSIPGSQQHT